MLQYWDANLFLYRLNRDVQYAPAINHLYTLALSSEHPIVTSELSIVEVAFTARERLNPDFRSEALAEINELLFAAPIVRMVPIDSALLEEARELVRRAAFARRQGGLQAADAIHLAAAARADASVFFTGDDRLRRAPRVIDIPMQEPSADWP